MKKAVLVTLLATIATCAHARDIKGEFIQWCGKTTIGDFAATNALNGGAGAPAGAVYFPPVAGLTFGGKPIQAILIREGSGSVPDVYGVTIAGTVESGATQAGRKAKAKTSTFQPGAVDIYCTATSAAESD